MVRISIFDFARIEAIFGAYNIDDADALILTTRNGETHLAIERGGETSSMCSLADWTPERWNLEAAS